MFLKIEKKKIWITLSGFVVFAALAYFFAWRYMDSETPRHASDPGFIMLENTPSPNKQHRILIYHYDTGAFGYSRAWWAVTPYSYNDLNLIEYELPDGYLTKGWSEQNELLVEKWEPYYYRDKMVELKTGDMFQGVRIKLVEPLNPKTGKNSGTQSTPMSKHTNGS